MPHVGYTRMTDGTCYLTFHITTPHHQMKKLISFFEKARSWVNLFISLRGRQKVMKRPRKHPTCMPWGITFLSSSGTTWEVIKTNIFQERKWGLERKMCHIWQQIGRMCSGSREGPWHSLGFQRDKFHVPAAAELSRAAYPTWQRLQDSTLLMFKVKHGLFATNVHDLFTVNCSPYN